MANDINVKIGLEGEQEFKQGIKEINAELKMNQSALALTNESFKNNSASVEALSQKGEMWKKLIETQTKKVSLLSKELENEIQKSGELGTGYTKRKTELNQATTTLMRYTDSLKRNNDALESAKLAQGDHAEELKASVNTISEGINLEKSNLALLDHQNQETAKSTKYLSERTEILKKIVEGQTEKLKNLNQELKNEEKNNGKGSVVAARKQVEINNLKIETEKYTKELQENISAIKGTEKAEEDAADAATKLSKSSNEAGVSANKSTKGIGAMTIALGDLAAKGIEKAITGLISLTKEMQEYNSDTAKLEQNARSAGVGMATLEKEMMNLNFITGETDSNIEALSNLMQAGFKDNNLGEAVEALSGAVIKFPDTLKIESLADSLQETLATGKATGQFAEMLGRMGIEVEKFDSGLQRAIKSGREQQYVLNILAKTDLPQVTQEYNKMNEEQRAYSDAQYKLTESMADLSKKTMPVMAEVITEITALLDEHADSVESIIGLIAAIANIILNIIAVLAMVPAPVWAILATIIATVTAIMKAQEALSGVSEALKIFTGGLSPAQMKILQIITIVTALASVLALLAMLWLSIKEGSDKAVSSMERMKNIQIAPPTVSTPKVKNAYAKGTFSAANGWALVGEDGPELVAFSGGERVYNARKTRSILESGISTGGGTQIGTLNIYPNASQWNQLMNLLQQSQRARHDSRMK